MNNYFNSTAHKIRTPEWAIALTCEDMTRLFKATSMGTFDMIADSIKGQILFAYRIRAIDESEYKKLNNLIRLIWKHKFL